MARTSDKITRILGEGGLQPFLSHVNEEHAPCPHPQRTPPPQGCLARRALPPAP